MIRLLAPGQVTDEAVVQARLDFEKRFKNAFGMDLPREWGDKWWRLDESSPPTSA